MHQIASYEEAAVNSLRIQPGLMITVQVAERVGQYFIDTGTACCIVSEVMLPFNQELRKIPKTLIVKGAGNHELNFLGIANLPIRFPAIGPEIFCYFDCLVCSGSFLRNFDGILGLSLLKKYNAGIDIERMVLKLNGNEIPVNQAEQDVFVMELEEFNRILAEIRMINGDLKVKEIC